MMRYFSKKTGTVLGLFFFITALTACSTEDSETSAEGSSNEEAKLVLNWFPKTEHGGVYGAQAEGYFAENGLDVTIEQGGPEVSSVQMVASGSADFGLAHADQLLMARDEGMDLVAVATTFQKNPQSLMYHEESGIESFEDINGKTAYIQPGIPYWEYLKNKYDLSEVKELSFSGDLTNFLDDPDAVSQSFVADQPVSLELQGINVEQLLLTDAGYNPYSAVLFTTRENIENNEGNVESFVHSFVEGWEYYEESPKSVHENLLEANSNLDEEALSVSEDTQHEFIYGGDAKENGVGYMKEERWAELIGQLYEIDAIDEKYDAEEVFTTEYLPDE